LLAQGRLAERLQRRYPDAHEVRTDGALYDYTMALKMRFMRNAAPLSKVVFDNRLHVIRNALGTHTTVARVQGNKLKAKREIRVAGARLSWKESNVVAWLIGMARPSGHAAWLS
jgi:predicted metal-dependent hydrolase